MNPELTVRTDVGVLALLVAVAVLIFAVIVIVKLMSKPSFVKLALLGFLGLAMFVGTFGLFGVSSYRRVEFSDPSSYPNYGPSHVVTMDEIRETQRQSRHEREVRRQKQLEETKAQLAAAMAEVKVAREEAKRQVEEAQMQAKQAGEIAREATRKAAEQQVWQEFAKGLTKGDWKESLKDVSAYLEAMEDVDFKVSFNSDDDAETDIVTYDDVCEEAPEWMIEFQRPGQIVLDGDTFRTMLSLGPDENLEQALRASLAECERRYYFDSNFARQFPINVSRRKLLKCVKRTHETRSQTTGLPVKYLLVEFDKSLTREMERHAQDAQAAESSVNAGIYGATTLGLVGMLFGFLKFGEWRSSRNA